MLHNPGKQIILCKDPAHMGIGGNKEADRVAKQAVDMPGMTMTRLLHTEYYLIIMRARNSEWQKEWENSTIKLYILQEIKHQREGKCPNSFREYKIKLSRITNNQHAEMQHVEIGDRH